MKTIRGEGKGRSNIPQTTSGERHKFVFKKFVFFFKKRNSVKSAKAGTLYCLKMLIMHPVPQFNCYE